MTQDGERVQLVRELFAARRGSGPGMGPRGSDLYTEDTELYIPFGIDAGLYRGREAVVEFWHRYFEAWGSIENEIEQIEELGDSVHIRWHAKSGSRAGFAAEQRGEMTYYFRGPKIARAVFYMEWMSAAGE